MVRFAVNPDAREPMLRDYNFLKTYGTSLTCFGKFASCRPRGPPNDLKTSEPTAETIRTAEPKNCPITFEKLRFTKNTEKITTESTTITDIEQSQIKLFYEKSYPIFKLTWTHKYRRTQHFRQGLSVV